MQRLRADHALAVEFTAFAGPDPIGHIAFSRLTVEPDSLALASLAPVGVLPLIARGLAVCRVCRFGAGAGSSRLESV